MVVYIAPHTAVAGQGMVVYIAPHMCVCREVVGAEETFSPC